VGIRRVKATRLSGGACHPPLPYHKLYRQDKQQYADPVADDLATLGLDIAVGEAGYERGGANPFLLIGT